MRDAFNLIQQGGGWELAVIGMGSVFTSLILLLVFIKIFAAIIKWVQGKGEKEEAAPETPLLDQGQHPTIEISTGAGPEVKPETAAAMGVALGLSSSQDELTAAVSYAMHDHLSGGLPIYGVPPAVSAAITYALHDFVANGAGGDTLHTTTAKEDGEVVSGHSPWSMAGRIQLMNARSRSTIGGK